MHEPDGQLALHRQLLPVGTLYLSRQATLLQAVLGYSVAVVIYCRRQQYGGMVHFDSIGLEKPTLADGRSAIIELLRTMRSYGAKRKDLCAQIFGGAGKNEISIKAGKNNVEKARRVLHQFNIEVISEDVGGSVPRKLVYNTKTNETMTAKVNNIRSSDWQLTGEQ